MKKVLVMAIVFVVMAVCIVGCNEILKGKGDKILATTDTVYLAVRVIVTDPGVLPKIGENDLGRLVAIEKAYLFAREKHIESSGKDKAILDILVVSADEMFEIIESIPGISKYDNQIDRAKTAVRIIQTLHGHPDFKA